MYAGENSMGLVLQPFVESLPDRFGFIKCGGFYPMTINGVPQGLMSLSRWPALNSACLNIIFLNCPMLTSNLLLIRFLIIACLGTTNGSFSFRKFQQGHKRNKVE